MLTPTLIFRACADETRLRILHLLTKGELCVCDLIAVIGASQPKISRHLSYLKRAGLIASRQEGRWRHYSLAKSTNSFQKSLMDCLRCCVKEVPRLRRDSAKLRESRIRCK